MKITGVPFDSSESAASNGGKRLGSFEIRLFSAARNYDALRGCNENALKKGRRERWDRKKKGGGLHSFRMTFARWENYVVAGVSQSEEFRAIMFNKQWVIPETHFVTPVPSACDSGYHRDRIPKCGHQEVANLK